jgi:Ca-activated chloride channel family protein
MQRDIGAIWTAAPAGAADSSQVRQAVHASPGNAAEQQAWQAWQAGRWAEAQQHYARAGGWSGHMGAGAAAWRLQDHGAALRHFSAALLLAEDSRQQADALYNQGNAAYALGRWPLAIDSYQTVLARRPGDSSAMANLELAQKRLAQARILPGAARSDLRGRGGRRGEGVVDPEVDRGGPVQDFDASSSGPVPDTSGDASGAQLSAAQRQARQMELDARRLQSGLAKMERLEPRPQVLLRGLLAQDAPPGHGGSQPPW